MKRKFKQQRSLRQRTRTATRVLVISCTLGISATLVVGWLVYMNLQQINDSKATGKKATSAGGGAIAGEILSEFTWEKDPVTMATLGPDASSSNGKIKSGPGGKSGTRGLCITAAAEEIGLLMQGSPYFDQDGLDISVDYRGSDGDGYFFARGNGFQFGLESNRLVATFRIDNGKGGYTTIKARTDYDVIHDGNYRNYRFSYTPGTGHAELTVNGAPVWIQNCAQNRALFWKGAGDVCIGKDLTSLTENAILDNLVIRSTGIVSPLAESLINFMLEGGKEEVTIHFTTKDDELVSSYSVERSVNGTDFQKIGTIEPGKSVKKNEEWVMKDPEPAQSGVVFYRLRQQLKSGKFFLHPLSAIRMKPEKGFSIERINPQPFDRNFDVSYFLPKPGRVWIQILDEKGKVMSSKTFEAQAGKNVHVHREDPMLPSGGYVLNIIFDNKKISSRIIKS